MGLFGKERKSKSDPGLQGAVDGGRRSLFRRDRVEELADDITGRGPGHNLSQGRRDIYSKIKGPLSTNQLEDKELDITEGIYREQTDENRYSSSAGTKQEGDLPVCIRVKKWWNR